MNGPELSIVVPVYNVEQWLPFCLDSILRQSFQKWECILVDDGSLDLSGIICDSYARSDSRFKVTHQENAGVSAARNTGIEAAAAPLLSFIDPDDLISSNFFSALISELERTNSDVAASQTTVTNEKGTERGYVAYNRISAMLRNISHPEMKNHAAVVDALCNNLFSCVSWGKVFTRQLWGNARFPIGVDLGEDMMTVPQVIIRARAAVFVSQAVYYWRTREKSLLHGTVTKERLSMDLKASGEMYKQLLEYEPNHKEDFSALKLQYDAGCLASYFESNPDIRRKQSVLSAISSVEGGKDFIANGIKSFMTIVFRESGNN